MKTILVIDDEPAILEVLSSVLGEEGYGVRIASNGKEGLISLRETIPDLVLCDIMMPLMDGREVCRAMQKDTRYRSVPIVLMSAAGITISDDCQYSALIAKPFELDELLDLVERLTTRQETSASENS